MTQVTDQTVITFGAHKGKALANVPDHYLKWLHGELVKSKDTSPLRKYLDDNIEAINENLKRSNQNLRR